MDTDAIVERAKALFARWFQINTEAKKREFRLPGLSLRLKGRGTVRKRYRRFAIGLADHPDNLYSVNNLKAGGFKLHSTQKKYGDWVRSIMYQEI